MKNEEELKTLNDISFYEADTQEEIEKRLRAEAIKWVKEDKLLIKNNPLLNVEKLIAIRFVERWMKRLDIKEEDLMTNEEINNREHGEIGNN